MWNEKTCWMSTTWLYIIFFEKKCYVNKIYKIVNAGNKVESSQNTRK